jgi:uncharacterized repeat protein (TIGR01451 family)
MKKLIKYRRFIVSLIGILPLIVSLGTSQVALAARSTSDISVTLIANRSKLKVGQTIIYTAIMTNLGPDDADSVDIRFNLPVQLTLVSMTCEFGITPDTPFCEYSSIKAGERVVSTLTATLNPDALTRRQRSLRVTADILLEEDCAFEPPDNCTFDPNLSNNLASVSTRLVGRLPHH